MKTVIGVNELDIDVNRTVAYYKQASPITCDCQGCRNFTMAINKLPKAVVVFLDSLGVSLNKLDEVSVLCRKEDGNILYNGFLYVCGRLLNNENVFIKTGERSYMLNKCRIYEVADGFEVHFTEGQDLIDDGFPRPAIQLNFTCTLPWVLMEKYQMN